MKNRNLIFLSLLVVGFSKIQSQDLQINQWLKDNPPAPKKINFLFQFDNRRSFVLDRPVKFSGLRIGIEYNEIHDIGFGFYSPVNPVRIKYNNPEIKNDDLKLELEATFSYTTLFYQFAFFHNEHWELAIPIHLGRGKAGGKVIYKDTDSLYINKSGTPELNSSDMPFTLSELGFDFQYRYHWLGLGTGVGYRFLLVGDERQRHLFDAAYVAFKVKILFGEIYKSINKRYSYEQSYLRKK